MQRKQRHLFVPVQSTGWQVTAAACVQQIQQFCSARLLHAPRSIYMGHVAIQTSVAVLEALILNGKPAHRFVIAVGVGFEVQRVRADDDGAGRREPRDRQHVAEHQPPALDLHSRCQG